MVFKRRDARPWHRIVAEWFYPRGGWARAARYIQYRLRRLPGTPEQIARGIFAGAFATFTPFYGLHFIFAAILATVMRGNILAALLSTFLGNPLTYIPIGVIALQTGYFLLGIEPQEQYDGNLLSRFGRAASDLWQNFRSIFTEDRAEWADLQVFYEAVFFPYLVGGIVPGIIFATICYYISVPLIRAYQNRRTTRTKKRMGRRSDRAGTPPTNRRT